MGRRRRRRRPRRWRRQCPWIALILFQLIALSEFRLKDGDVSTLRQELVKAEQFAGLCKDFQIGGGGGDDAVSKMREELGAARQYSNLAKEFCPGSRRRRRRRRRGGRRRGGGGGRGRGRCSEAEAVAEADVVAEAEALAGPEAEVSEFRLKDGDVSTLRQELVKAE